jgi:hypothetical protein
MGSGSLLILEFRSKTAWAKLFPCRVTHTIAIAGRLDHVSMILSGLTSRLDTEAPALWYDSFIEHCEKNFLACRDARLFSKDRPPEAALIYGDIRHKRGETKCRLIRLVFGCGEDGPASHRQPTESGKSVAIGWTPEGRAELNEAAKSGLGDLYNRHLELRELTEAGIRELGHVSASPGPVRGFVMDTGGPPDRTFCVTLRRFCAQTLLKGGPTLAFEPVTALCAAAVAAIECRFRQLRREKAEGIEGVGDVFTSGSLTLRHGFLLYSGPNLSVIESVAAALHLPPRSG